jgi:predicted nucleic acid-binding protein
VIDPARLRELRRRLAAHRVVGLDSMVFIYHVEANPLYVPWTRAVLEMVERGALHAVTSTLTLLELTVHPWRLGQEAVAREYEALLVHFPHLHVVDITRDVTRRAAQLRGHYGVGPVDALQAAAALRHGASALVTNDLALRRLAGLLEIIVLDDYLAVG